jgi:NADPH-dependent glutamate synthase beta subunit-like oxidoreductase
VKLRIPGDELDGVLVGLEFLRGVNAGKPVKMGKRVVVLGGGNVAFDCARMALRMGAEEVRMACLESRAVMPAACDEIQQGEEEGILVHPSRTFTRILADDPSAEDGRITGVECLEVASFEFDEEGRVQIDAVEGSEHVLPADTVIFAIGQRPQIPDEFGLDTDVRGRIEVDPYTLDTSVEGVFAVGDAVSGTAAASAAVIEAIASGKKGASAVDRYLGGSGVVDEELAPVEEPGSWLGRCEGFAAQTRCQEHCIGAAERTRSCAAIPTAGGIVLPLEEDAALAESSRCLQCDLRLKITPVKFWADY